MVTRPEDRVKAEAVEPDLARIRRRWREYKRAVPNASAFFFLAHIAATGRIPAGPREGRKAA